MVVILLGGFEALSLSGALFMSSNSAAFNNEGLDLAILRFGAFRHFCKC
jgi:hypothetical protein